MLTWSWSNGGQHGKWGLWLIGHGQTLAPETLKSRESLSDIIIHFPGLIQEVRIECGHHHPVLGHALLHLVVANEGDRVCTSKYHRQMCTGDDSDLVHGHS